MNGQNFYMFYTLFIYALLIFMALRMFNIIKASKRGRVVVEAVQKVADENEFYEYINENKEKATPDIKTKLEIIELWGKAFHKNNKNYEELVNKLELNNLLVNTNKGTSIERAEDAFFYLALAIPNMLYGNGLNEERKMVNNKLKEIKDDISDQLVINIGEACNKYYDNIDDKGQSFFEKVLEGDYGEYKYSKQLIGLYKEICNAMLYKIYDEKGDERKAEYKDSLDLFATRGVGERWLKAIDLEVNNEVEIEEEKE